MFKCRKIVKIIFLIYMAMAIAVAVPVLLNIKQDSFHAAFKTAGVAWAGGDDLFAITPQEIAANLEGYFKKAEDAVAANEVRKAREQLSLIAFKIEKYRKSLSKEEKKAYETRVASLNAAVKQKVDSLVKVNLAIVGKSGRTAGTEFRQDLAAHYGLSEAELAQVDEAIIESAPAEEEVREKPAAPASLPVLPASPVTPAIPAAPPQQIVQETPPTKQPTPQPAPAPPPVPVRPEPSPAPVVSQPAPVAPPRQVEIIPQKRDTVPVVAPAPAPAPQERAEAVSRNNTKAVLMADKVRALLDGGKIEEAKTVFSIYQESMLRVLDRPAFDNLKSAVEAASTQEKNQHSRASEQAQKIESLLDRDKISEANEELAKSRPDLERYLDREDLRALEERVQQASAALGRRQAEASKLMREIRANIAENKIEDAYVTYEKSRPDLERGLARDEFEGLKNEVTDAYNALQDKKKLCELCRRDIVSLVKAGMGAAAYARFTENRTLLAQYLDAKNFASLESSAERANKDFTVSRDRARGFIARVDSLVSREKAEEAHQLFEETKDRARRDLADDKRFLECRDRLEKAYSAFLAEKRQADQTSRTIEYLIARREGRKAHQLFQQEAAQLEKYLEANAAAKLGRDADMANKAYESNRAAARSKMTEVEGLLAQDKTERAYVVYSHAQDDIDFYCADDPRADTLGKRVNEAHAALGEHNKWASSMVRQIRDLVDKNKGNQAREQYQNARAELRKYVDLKTITSLDSIVAQADKKFAAAKTRAERHASNVREMIVQKRIEDAYAAFDTLENELRFYLEANEFSAIKTLVEKFNDQLQDKRGDALRIAGTINRFIEQDQGDSAYNLFMRRDAYLAEFLNAKTYKSVASRASRAKTDFEQSGSKARALAQKVRGMLAEDRAEAANALFEDKRDYLRHYLDKADFAKLESGVRTANEAFLQKRKKARAVVSVINRMLWQNKSVEARAEFARSDDVLSRFLPRDEYIQVKTKVEHAYSAAVAGRREAHTAAAGIRQLVAKGRLGDAYRAFQGSRQTLELYLSEAEFTGLQNEVVSAYDEQEDKRKQVKEYAKKLRQFVSRNKLWDAYKGFKLNRVALRQYLDAESYVDLENTVVSAYNKAHEKVRKR
jgi:hypothetical protein